MEQLLILPSLFPGILNHNMTSLPNKASQSVAKHENLGKVLEVLLDVYALPHCVFRCLQIRTEGELVVLGFLGSRGPEARRDGVRSRQKLWQYKTSRYEGKTVGAGEGKAFLPNPPPEATAILQSQPDQRDMLQWKTFHFSGIGIYPGLST